MNIQRAVYDELRKKLEDEQRQLRAQLVTGRGEMRRLVERQTITKRKLAALGNLIHSMGPKP